MSISDVTEKNGTVTWARSGELGKSQVVMWAASTAGPWTAVMVAETVRKYEIPGFTAGMAYAVLDADQDAIKTTTPPAPTPPTPPTPTPPTPTPPTPTPPAPTSGVVWAADLSQGVGTGNAKAGGSFSYVAYVADHVQVVADPKGVYGDVIEFAVNDSDRPINDSDNEPRADLESPSLFTEGSDLYVALGFLIPTGLTVAGISPGFPFFNLHEVYGQPYDGSPTNAIMLSGYDQPEKANYLSFGVAGVPKWWAPAPVDGEWHTIIQHIVMSTSGLVELWFDDASEGFSLSYPTWAKQNDGAANVSNLQSYRQAGTWPGVVTHYALPPAVCLSLASAQAYLASLKAAS